MSDESKIVRPQWAPKDAGSEFASFVAPGVANAVNVASSESVPLKPPGPEQLAEGLLSGNRALLARAITLVESNAPRHRAQADELVRLIMPHAGKSIRIGISGPPGVGKSTFIDSWGCRLIERGHKVAVLAIDPSSSIHRGSILGDKTRMENLVRHPEAFIRPSPSGGALGGVGRKTRETMFLAEAAGFDVILVETVGVGQSETTVRSMTDLFLLLQLAGSGDDLQGIKKGIMEIADLIAVTKADGDNRQRAGLARAILHGAVLGLQPYTQGWKPPVVTCSSVSGDGLDTIWNEILLFREHCLATGIFEARRHAQIQDWVWSMAHETLVDAFSRSPQVAQAWLVAKVGIEQGELSAPAALKEVLQAFRFPTT